MIVDSNAPSPLKYTDPTFQVSLFIRAKIYDTSGVSPSLENSVNLQQIDNGTYWAKYTFTAGKTYLVQKLVYTDGTYSTVDQSYAQDNDDVQCIDLKTANLDAAISTRAPAATALSTAQWTNARAAFLDFLDVAVSSRAPSATALSTAQWTNARAALLDFLDVAISSRLASGSYTAPDNAGISAIEAKTNNLPADPADNSDILAAIAGITSITPTQVANAVWDAMVASHVGLGTFGKKVGDLTNSGGGGGGCTSDNCAVDGTVEALELTGTVTVTEDLSNC